MAITCDETNDLATYEKTTDAKEDVMAIVGVKEIVVIEDDQDAQDLISRFFTQKGYKVTAFSDAESALSASVNEIENWQVILTDLRLPNISGIQVIEFFKKKAPNTPVILMTTAKGTDAAFSAVEKGAYDFIVKPIHYPQLLVSVERAIHFKSLNSDISQLRAQVKSSKLTKPNIVGKSPKFVAAINIAKKVAKSKANIFIFGESGTGKEVFARFIHSESSCSDGPFVAINCAAIPENLLESELFGHAKGSFTGAHEKKIGLFEEAEDGTLFLDEIGDLSLALQAKLLRVLQEKKIKRVGENQVRAINCRIISATHRNLVEQIQEEHFREDLFFRLNVIPIHIPPLRDRKDDLVPIAEYFLKRFVLENDSPAKSFSKEALKYILDNTWRGNVRELENTIERAVVLSSEAQVKLEDMIPLGLELNSKSDSPVNEGGDKNTFQINCSARLPLLDEVIASYVEFAVSFNGGAKDRTAKELGIDRKTLYKRLRIDTKPGVEATM